MPPRRSNRGKKAAEKPAEESSDKGPQEKRSSAETRPSTQFREGAPRYRPQSISFFHTHIDEKTRAQKSKAVNTETLTKDLEDARSKAEVDVTSLYRRLYNLEDEKNRANEEYKRHLDMDTSLKRPRGRSRGSSEAKKAWKALEDEEKRLKKSDALSGAKRQALHDKRRNAEAASEDFFYYQNTNHRAERLSELDPTKEKKEKDNRVGKNKPPILLRMDYPDPAWLQAVLDHFDAFEVGDEGGPKGRKQARRKLHRQMESVPPGELHLWTPASRWPPVGLGEPQEPGGPKREPDLDLDLDFESIEERRREVEDGTGKTKTDPEMTHSRRREDEPLLSDKILTANTGKIKERHSGLWNAAAETSDDFLTSYDLLGRVKTAWVCANPRLEADRSQVDFDMRLNKYIQSTPWAEETYGRREFHVHEGFGPSSPVESPPHSPISDVDSEAFPVDVSKNDPDRIDYKMEFEDHFQIHGDGWPNFPDPNKGDKRGCRVPYAPKDIPTDVSNLTQKVVSQRTEDLDLGNLIDEHGKLSKPAPNGTAMHIYRQIAMETFKDYEDPEPRMPSDGNDDDDDNSDDEGDLFTTSYKEGSGTVGAGQGSGVGDGGGGSVGDGGPGHAGAGGGSVEHNAAPSQSLTDPKGPSQESNKGDGPPPRKKQKK